MSFQFINNNSPINPKTRRSIRRHAATGKNVGKTLVRRSRKQAPLGPRPAQLTLPASVPRTTESEFTQSKPCRYGIVNFDRQIGDGLSVCSLPAELRGESRLLVHQAITLFCRMHYTPQLSEAFQPHKGPPTMWFQLTFEDEAYFHIVMAISITRLNKIISHREDPALALQHQTRAFVLINSRLSQADPVSDANLAVVVMVSQYERLQGRYVQALVHLDGLYEMIELRGGIIKLTKENLSLAQKIIRLDLDLALYLGTAPRFPVAKLANDSLGMSSFLTCSGAKIGPETCGFSDCPKLSIELQDIAQNIIFLAKQVQDAHMGRRPALNLRTFHIALLLLGHQLIHFSPLAGPRPTEYIDNAVQLGLTAFLMPFMHHLDGRMPDNPLLSHLIHSFIHQSLTTTKHEQEILLWVLLMGGASVFSQPKDAWLAFTVSRTTESLCLHSWDEVASRMGRYPWLEAIHRKTAESLCGF